MSLLASPNGGCAGPPPGKPDDNGPPPTPPQTLQQSRSLVAADSGSAQPVVITIAADGSRSSAALPSGASLTAHISASYNATQATTVVAAMNNWIIALSTAVLDVAP